MRIKRKLLAVVLCLSMVTCLFAGCGGSSEDETTKAASTKTGGDLVIEGLGTDQNADYSVEGTVTVAVDTARATDYEALFDALQQAYPKLDIQFDYFSHTDKDSAAEYLSAKASAGKMPDIIWDEAATDGSLMTYISQGWVYPLDEFVKDDPDFKYIPENLVKNYTFCDKLYALPHQAQFEEMVVNLDVLDALNLDMPELDWTLEDFEKYLKAATNSTYSGIEKLFQIPSLVVSAYNPKDTINGYNEDTHQFEADAYVKALKYMINLRAIPGLEAWALRRTSTGDKTDYVKKFGTDEDNAAFDKGLTLFHGVGTWELADAQSRWSDKNWTSWTIPQNKKAKGVMPYHVDHCFMTSSCENTKAAWQVLRFITYSSEGNLARLSMYDETNTGKYATINKLYYPTTSNPKVAEKFNSLPGVTEVDKYLFNNIDKCRRIDVEKIVPQYNDITKNYFDEAQNQATDGTSSNVEPIIKEAVAKANPEMKKAWEDFEKKVLKVQKDFEQKHSK